MCDGYIVRIVYVLVVDQRRIHIIIIIVVVVGRPTDTETGKTRMDVKEERTKEENKSRIEFPG